MSVLTVRELRAALDADAFGLLVVAIVALGLVALALLRRRGARTSSAVLAVLGAWVAIAAVAELTLIGGEGIGADPRLYLDPVEGAWGWRGIAWRPVVDNVTLFVPVGAALAAWWRRTSLTAVWLAALALSMAVEGFQLLVPTGRIANSADVLANATGALIGVALARLTGVRWVAGDRSP